MKRIILTAASLLFLFLQSYAQLHTFYVPPIATNSAYAAVQDSNYVSVNIGGAGSNGKLFVFIPGTGGKPSGYTYIADVAAMLGYHSVIVSYRDTPTVGSVCAPSADSLCYDKYRQQVCFGTPVSTAGIDTLNSINTRLYNLLVYLNTTYPTSGWGQFISGGHTLWNKVAVSGHSQGSGHAMYIGKQESCERVLMFSGADDSSAYYQSVAHWERQPGVTSTRRLYGFLALQNEGIPYATLYHIQQVLGVTQYGDSVDVDNVPTPYRHSHCLYTNATPRHTGPDEYHGSTVVNVFTPVTNGAPVFQPVWTYMLTDSTFTTGISGQATASQLLLYPNPAGRVLNMQVSGKTGNNNAMVRIINAAGHTILSRQYTFSADGRLQLELPQLPVGIYSLILNSYPQIITSQFIVNGE